MSDAGPMRTRIRARSTEVLAMLPPFAGHIFNARSPVLRRDLLPAVRVYADRDTRLNASANQDIGWFEGELALTVQVIVDAGADPEVNDTLDTLCALVETALLTDPDWRRMAPMVGSIETDFTQDDQGELRTAIATMTMALTYADCIQREFPDDLRRVRMRLDFVDPPADPNTEGHPTEPPDGYPGGYPGPDGRVEVEFEVDLPVDQES